MEQMGIIEISVILGALLTFVSFGTFIIRTIKSILAPLKKIRDATRTTLRHSIVNAHSAYMEDGRISHYALQSLHDMYEQYKELGGNGFVGDLLEDIRKLPIETKYEEEDF